jgi:hypothetical protein
MKIVSCSLALLFLIIACEKTQESETKFETGGLTHRGHEDITRYGVEHANAYLAATTGIDTFFPVPEKGVAGSDSGNKIIRGNFETDFPEKKFLDFYQSKSRLPLLRWMDWHESPTLQHLHGLRNRPDGEHHQDQFATCRETTDAIATALDQALPLLRADRNSESGRHWLGHATHIIQDTFSKAHAIRSGENLKTLIDHCTYGVKDPAICYHNESDDRDKVWEQDGGSCEFDTNNRNWSCIKPEAQAAALASAGFLALAGKLALNPQLDARAMVQDWFRGAPSLYESGYLECRPMGLLLLDDYFVFIAGKAIPGAERDIVNEKLKNEFVPELKSYLFDKYAPSIITELAGITLDEAHMQRYLPYLRDYGFIKLGDKIFIEDSIEWVRLRHSQITGKEVDPVWLPRYTTFLLNNRSLAALDAEIKRQSTPPTTGPVLDECGNLSDPFEILKCRSKAPR